MPSPVSSSQSDPSGLKRLCLWLHRCSSPPLPLPVSCGDSCPPSASRRLPLLLALLLCGLLLMVLLLLWNYHCVFISHLCSPLGEEGGEMGS